MKNKIKINQCNIESCNKKGRLLSTGTECFVNGLCNYHYRKTVVHPLKGIYVGMLHRCNNTNSHRYYNYGARGITVCNKWQGINGFKQFCEDMSNRPLNTSIDRINNDLGYSKENCRWATIHEQANNKRNSNKIVGISKYIKNGHTYFVGHLTLNNTTYQKSFKTEDKAIEYRQYLLLTHLT